MKKLSSQQMSKIMVQEMMSHPIMAEPITRRIYASSNTPDYSKILREMPSGLQNSIKSRLSKVDINNPRELKSVSKNLLGEIKQQAKKHLPSFVYDALITMTSNISVKKAIDLLMRGASAIKSLVMSGLRKIPGISSFFESGDPSSKKAFIKLRFKRLAVFFLIFFCLILMFQGIAAGQGFAVIVPLIFTTIFGASYWMRTVGQHKWNMAQSEYFK
jgi:hypothetical protein